MTTLDIHILCPDEFKDIVTATLSEGNFEGFWEDGNSLHAYISENLFQDKWLYDTLAAWGLENNYSVSVLPEKNWNEEWEKNYEPIVIAGKLRVRAPFHPKGDELYDIVIQPKMSFGTGHHATTRLCAALFMNLDIGQKKVLDMGCGTGVLAILAETMGALRVLAIDNDPWSVENAIGNAQLNSCKYVEVLEGSTDRINSEVFDIVISNITKNINLHLLPDLAQAVSMDGYFIISGFLDFDREEMQRETEKFGFKFMEWKEEEKWQGLCFQKII